MKKAKWYVYRNLTKGCYSVKYRGKVVKHLTSLLVANPIFIVNDKGRQRVIKERQKNVHAYVASESEPVYLPDNIPVINSLKVKYDPYKYNSFVYRADEEPVGEHEFAVLNSKGVCVI